MENNGDFQKEFDSIFSIYLSNDMKSPGDISFGGYDLAKFAKKGKELFWTNQSNNDQYWTTNSKGVKFGKKLVTKNHQQVIFDNGMSQTMAPEKSFVELVKALDKYGFRCYEAVPLWSCEKKDKTNPMSFGALTDLEFALLTNEKGDVKSVRMPPPSYMNYDDQRKVFVLLISPWQFSGMGGKAGEEYWILGANFL